MNDLSIGFLLITSPLDGLSLCLYRKRIPIFILLLSSLSTSVGFSLIFSFHLNMMIFLSLFLFWIFFKSAILHISCEIVGGCGDVKRLFLSLATSLFPLIFFTPFVIVGKVFPISFLGIILIFLWVFILKIKFIKNLYSLSFGKTILAISFPSIIFSFLLFILFLGFIISFLYR
ncbi:MAG: hypothetical protein AB1297_03435 [bacterium]